MKVGCIGSGNMGKALVGPMKKIVNGKDIFVSAKHFENAVMFSGEEGVVACRTNTEVAKNSDIIFLAVKPAFIKEVLEEIKDYVQGKTIVSMAAGVNLYGIFFDLGKNPENLVIRIMPNMPAAIGEAMTALSVCEDSKMDSGVQEKVDFVIKLLKCSGKVEVVPEKLMDCVTAVSGSGPAYVFMFIEAFADAAVQFGMPRKQAYTYAAQTVLGSAKMVLETGTAPAVLKDAVCSPGGTTIQGVAALEKNGMRSAVFEAVKAAFEKSASMGK